MRTPLRLLVAVLGGILLSSLAASAADDSRRRYDIPAGEAAAALQRYSALSGRETLFAAAVVRGVRTPAVAGELTAQEALDALLAGTGLVATVDAASGAVAVRREVSGVVRGDGPAPAGAAAVGLRRSDGVVQLEAVEVTGSRIRSILGEQGVNPVLTFTRAEIEQSGVTSLSDLRTLIPQLSVGNTTQFDGNSSGGSPEGRLTFTLRGITGNNTLVLVDGRRLPRTGQRVGATENYELTGLPLSAIERVEVLLDGGSAVYGADAIGGVVNIITRKNYSGSELEFAYDNTFAQDAANKRVSLSTSHRAGRLGFRASLSYEDQNALARRDRAWLASDDRRPIGGTDARSTIFVGGVVRPVSGTLPGTGGATVLRIPAGSDGRNLTVADFVAAGVPTDAERYDAGQTQNALNEFFRWSASAQADYRFRPWLTAFGSYTFNRYRSYGDSGPVALSTATNTVVPANTTTLPANYPGNPFGVPINVQKFVWELGDLNRRYQIDTHALTFGVRGDLPGDWRYDAAVSWAKSDPITLDPFFQFSPPLLAPAIQGPNPPILLNNSLTFGAANPPGTLERYFLTGSNQDVPQTWTYEVRANGPLLEWWGGTISSAVGAEVREEYVDFNRQQFSAISEAAQPEDARVVQAAYAELAVPLVSPARGVPLVNQLAASLAVRHDSYDEFGDATKPRYGATYRPWRWLMLRGTYGEAFKVPTLSDLNRPTARGNVTFVPSGPSFVLFDTFRNEQLLGSVVNVTGGNPSLLPEESVTRNFGVVLEPPLRLLKGLSVSVDSWDIRMTNRVGSVSYQDRLAFRPDLFLRAEPTPADVAAGRPGRIVEIDNRSINIAEFRTAGFDYAARYHRAAGAWGDFTLRADVTRTTRYESITRPGLAPLATTSPLSRPLRGTVSADWLRYGLGLGVTSVYQEGFRTTVTSAATETPSTVLWNLRASYDFDQGRLLRLSGKWQRLFAGVRVNAALLNAWDLEPPLTSTGTPSGAVDSRGRRYTLTVRKAF